MNEVWACGCVIENIPRELWILDTGPEYIRNPCPEHKAQFERMLSKVREKYKKDRDD